VRQPTSIVWFRNDLRLADNPALTAALKRGGPVLPVFLWSPDEEGDWAPGAASRWWLHHSLASLGSAIGKLDSVLLIRQGETLGQLRQLARQSGANAVFWNDCYEPRVVLRDRHVKESLRGAGIDAQSFSAGLLHEPGTVLNQAGKPYQVFTPFWRACLGMPDPPLPLHAPRRLPSPASWPRTLPLDALALLPAGNWARDIEAAWQPGEAGARANLRRFIRTALAGYADGRNRPDQQGTSRLSPHLHFGEISPRQVWHALATAARETPKTKAGKKRRPGRSQATPVAAWRSSQFMAEIGWREFAHHLLFHFPHTPREPLRPKFRKFPWRFNARLMTAWQRGRTGYPLVDAGMRELWATGWMHNRVRMVAASFLVKDLLIDWRRGAAWFWDTLVDADLANNTLGWQWVAGCGADAAPYYRVFNPVGQGEKFDPDGDYVRRWVPELARLPDNWIHRPFDAPAAALKKAGVVLGRDYPEPVVSHAFARQVALMTYAKLGQD
jgi:deoxyribodipyrimidine photo-lyase